MAAKFFDFKPMIEKWSFGLGCWWVIVFGCSFSCRWWGWCRIVRRGSGNSLPCRWCSQKVLLLPPDFWKFFLNRNLLDSWRFRWAYWFKFLKLLSRECFYLECLFPKGPFSGCIRRFLEIFREFEFSSFLFLHFTPMVDFRGGWACSGSLNHCRKMKMSDAYGCVAIFILFQYLCSKSFR